MKYSVFQRGESVYSAGEPANHLFIILRGSVSMRIKNPDVKDWEWAQTQFSLLKEWKAKEFDVRLEALMIKSVMKEKLAANAKQLVRVQGNPKQGTQSRSKVTERQMQQIHLRVMEDVRHRMFARAKKLQVDTNQTEEDEQEPMGSPSALRLKSGLVSPAKQQKKVSEGIKEEASDDMKKFLQLWLKRKTLAEPFRFGAFSAFEMTDEEIEYFVLMKKFMDVQWFVERQQLLRNKFFGE